MKLYLATNKKSLGTVTFQRRDRTGAWKNYLEVPVPRGSRYDVWIEDQQVWLAVHGVEADEEGQWVRVLDREVQFGHYVGLHKGRTAVAEDPIRGLALARMAEDGQTLALAVLGYQLPEEEASDEEL